MARYRLLRHLETADTLASRYSGRDLPLIGPVERVAPDLACPVERLVVSPALRTRQTADGLWPEIDAIVDERLRELDFGRFSGHTADELAHDDAYRAWVDSLCLGPIPGGESYAELCARVALAWRAWCVPDVIFVTHNGPIQAVLETFAHIPLFQSRVRPGDLVTLEDDNDTLRLVSVTPFARIRRPSLTP